MKPRNFPTRKLRRKIIADWAAGKTQTEENLRVIREPKDIRIRLGANKR